MDPQKLFEDALTYVRHEVEDIHYIGEALPAPSNPAQTLSTASAADPGGSAVPAREDHVHSLDLQDLIDAINADPDIDLSNYYTKAEVNTLFTSYYTSTQVDALLAALDYYTQAQVDALFAALDYYTQAQVDALLAALDALPTGGTEGDILVKASGTDGDADWETIYATHQWSYPGVVNPQALANSSIWRPPQRIKIHQWRAELETAAGSNLVVKLYVASSLVDTITLTAASPAQASVIDEIVTGASVVECTVDASATGTGEHLSVTLEYLPDVTV